MKRIKEVFIMEQEKKKCESINDLMSGFPDIIESAYDISADVDGINDMIQSDLYNTWINAVDQDDTLSLDEKANHWERIAKSYREDRLSCESVVCNERKERTDNMIKIFQKVIIPSMIVLSLVAGTNRITKLPQFQKE